MTASLPACFGSSTCPPEGDNFDRLMAQDKETIRDTDGTHGTTRIARLSRAQHYSGEQNSPTNLIDFTESMPVALYFACRDSPRQRRANHHRRHDGLCVE